MLNEIKLQKRKGFTLLEVIGAIFVISIGVAGAFRIIPSIQSSFSVSSSKLSAAYLAQEGIEIVRNIRDGNFLENINFPTNWDEGLDGCSAGCEVDYNYLNQENPVLPSFYAGNYLNIDGGGFYSYQAGTPTKFKRKIAIDISESDILKVSIEISWQEKGKDYSFSVQENLYKWQ